MVKRDLNRRTFLRGAGTVAIALPFLEEMMMSKAFAATPEPPVRAMNVFFGLGLPPHVQDDHLQNLTGPFEPLQPVANKLGFVRGLGYPGTHHVGGAMGAFTGAQEVDDNTPGGPSYDQVMLKELYPNGLPAGMIDTLGTGVFFTYKIRASSGDFRRIKSWKDNASRTGILPYGDPSALFNRIFGNVPMVDPTDHLRRSLLDSVVAQYQHFKSPASGLSARSRSKISDHFDRIREYETRIFAPDAAEARCATPEAPTDPDIFGGQQPDENRYTGVNIDIDDVTEMWRLNVDLLVLAYQCDLTRFGFAHFLNTGDRIDLRGDYRYNNQLVYNFNDNRDWVNDGMSSGDQKNVSHEWFHNWNNRGQSGEDVGQHHLHFHFRELAYLLGRLDDPTFTEENGGTLLDNIMMVMTTELSEPGRHLTTDVFHAYSAGNDRLETGGQIFGGASRPAADFYSTILSAYGISRNIGAYASDIGSVRV